MHPDASAECGARSASGHEARDTGVGRRPSGVTETVSGDGTVFNRRYKAVKLAVVCGAWCVHTQGGGGHTDTYTHSSPHRQVTALSRLEEALTLHNPHSCLLWHAGATRTHALMFTYVSSVLEDVNACMQARARTHAS